MPAKSWLQAIRAAHRAADEAAQKPQKLAAARELRGLLAASPELAAEDLLWAQQDIYGRIAELELSLEEHEAALATCETALTLSVEPSIIVANLYLLQGQAFEALGQKEQAIGVYHEALVMNEVLMKRSLGEE